MHSRSAEIVAAVRACVGTRFRSQGRLPGVGLDCVGVALVAATAAGACPGDLPAYSLAGDHEVQLDDILERWCMQVTEAKPGDLIVFAPAPLRRHLTVVTERGVVHAHAGLMRVVESPPDPDWIVVAAWRFAGDC